MDLDTLIARLSEPRTLGIIAVVIVLLILFKRIFSRPKVSPHITTSRCGSCGWTGQVSKFKPVCPRCAKPIAL